jgi:NTE family protein
MGIVLTGGGARGAYQAGAVLAIAEITGRRELPFPVLAGSSAGSISTAYLASRADEFSAAARDLADLWTTLSAHDVYRTDSPTIAKTAAGWLADLSLGGWSGPGRGIALLDSSPLRALLERHFDARALERHVEAGRVHGIGITATDYGSGNAVTFFEGTSSIEPWNRVTRVGMRRRIEARHVLASAAIPLFFPAVEIDGDWYADGCIRLATPLSPAIRMGADRMIAVAVRATASVPRPPGSQHPSPAATAGMLLDALLLDALEADIERMERINQTLALVPAALIRGQLTALHPVSVLLLRPSVDPGALVLKVLDRIPAPVRHLLRGLGAREQSGWDLLSYLAFDGTYTSRLLDLGYDDTMARAEEIQRFVDGR